MTEMGAPAAAIPGAADTIVAAATPLGRGALSIVRLSGSQAHQIGRRLCQRWPGAPRQAVLTEIRDMAGTTLDHAVVLRYDAPSSFTGEDCVEFSTHGGTLVPTTVIAALIEGGARLAEPGEFTRRALLNGKLDILQAEATADLIGAGSRAAQRVALHQLDGGLSRRIAALRDSVIEIEALIAYDIDFPEEDDGPIPPQRTLSALDNLEGRIGELLATAKSGELIREGALVVLAGRPNVGKSSLFNALLGSSRAIVTPVPGTTRDALEAVVEADPWPIRLVDTAGLRHATELVERLGIEVSETYVRRAAIVLCCGDDARSVGEAVQAVRAVLARGSGPDTRPLLLVRTKCDLDGPSGEELSALGKRLGTRSPIAVSAETGFGIQSLLKAIVDTLDGEAGAPELDAPVLTQARHQLGVARALAELRDFRAAWREKALPATIAAVHLHAAAGALGDLIGAIDTDQVLDEVFRRFCIGK